MGRTRKNKEVDRHELIFNISRDREPRGHRVRMNGIGYCDILKKRRAANGKYILKVSIWTDDVQQVVWMLDTRFLSKKIN